MGRSPACSIKSKMLFNAQHEQNSNKKIENQEDNMPRIELNLNKADDLKKVKAQWRVGPGLVPGEPNEGDKRRPPKISRERSSPSSSIVNELWASSSSVRRSW